MPLTIAEKVAELTFRAADVIAGRGMATLPEPAKPAPPEPLPAPTTRLHASKHIRWTDDAGVVQTAGAYFDCNLPPAMAEPSRSTPPGR
jgi:hypothetical protein